MTISRTGDAEDTSESLPPSTTRLIAQRGPAPIESQPVDQALSAATTGQRWNHAGASAARRMADEELQIVKGRSGALPVPAATGRVAGSPTTDGTADLSGLPRSAAAGRVAGSPMTDGTADLSGLPRSAAAGRVAGSPTTDGTADLSGLPRSAAAGRPGRSPRSTAAGRAEAGLGAPEKPAVGGRLSALREFALIAALFLLYKVARLAADGHVEEAFRNARAIWDAERWLRLPGELAVQQCLLDWGVLVEVANGYYAYVHFPATAACLIWLYRYRPAHYRWTRNVLVSLTGAALAVHFVCPLAPPRMLSETGMLDLGRLYGPAVYGPPETDQISNQYAAMPSLHVGWALVVAIALIAATSSRYRALWLLHPVITLLVVVATGNHYWLDAFAAAALLIVAYTLLRSRRPAAAVPRARTVAPEPAKIHAS
ncbi:phosphatase PAP2 family protein [Actinoplanes sp. NPDC049802]|uniref:phosphatase PAP2 family protein n=1 Tax=Actinoplanes sp. NPDC049802 TaxID=3154742 RepID=UPI0033CBBD87